MNIKHGYDLERIELYNWGSFKDWQTIVISRPSDAGEQPKPSALLVGVNGSGKTTLLDAIMATMYPYEGSLKLGVVVDSEDGTSARDIRDYVLGKHESDSSESAGAERLYSRKDGISAILLVWRHRENPDKAVTNARIWRYRDHSLSDETLGFVGVGRYSLGPNHWGAQSICDQEGRPFSGYRDLKRFVQGWEFAARVFNKNLDYFQELREKLGGYTGDDFKLLNRAYYVKAIADIDSFVRSQMLEVNGREAIDELVGSIEQAGKITRAIDRAERQLSHARKIIAEFEARKQAFLEQKRLLVESSLLQVIPDWLSLRSAQKEMERQKAKVASADAELPAARSNHERIQREFQRHLSLASKDTVLLAIDSLCGEVDDLQAKVHSAGIMEAQAKGLSTGLSLKLPVARKDIPAFHLQLEEKKRSLHVSVVSATGMVSEVLSRKRDLEGEAKSIRVELEHLQKHQTQLDSKLYGVKLRCESDLKLPKGSIAFVAELIAVREDATKFRRAIESALSPISRSLLCHPKHLEKVTKWIHENHLERALSTIRIREGELENKIRVKPLDRSILSKIELLPERKGNAFFGYLWSWLLERNDYEIVSVEEFHSRSGRMVTESGLFKNNEKVMRKLERDLQFVLGWNSEEKKDGLIRRLHEIHKEMEDLGRRQSTLEKESANLQAQEVSVLTLLQLPMDFLDREVLEDRLSRAKKDLVSLQKKNKTVQQWQEQRSALEKASSEAGKCVTKLELERSNASEELDRQERIFSVQTKKVDELLSESSLEKGETLLSYYPDAYDRLAELELKLEQEGKSWQSLSKEIELQRDRLQSRLQKGDLAVLLREYRDEFQDTDLSYAVPGPFEVEAAMGEWARKAEELESTGLPAARAKWAELYRTNLVDRIRDALSSVREVQKSTQRVIEESNAILKNCDYENIGSDTRYLELIAEPSSDPRVRAFNLSLADIETVLAPAVRIKIEREGSVEPMKVLEGFVQSLTGDGTQGYRDFVTDVRNHFKFSVHSRKRDQQGGDPVGERFYGARYDGKSNGQTAHLAYFLLAFALAYRFRFHDPVRGKDTPRLLILDEFAGKLDNIKPVQIVDMLGKLGFQTIYITPLGKCDLMGQHCGNLIYLHKVSHSECKMSYLELGRVPFAELKKQLETGVLISQLDRKNGSATERPPLSAGLGGGLLLSARKRKGGAPEAAKRAIRAKSASIPVLQENLFEVGQ